MNSVLTGLDQFRGTPYIQADLCVSRPFKLGERVSIVPFAEFFNLFNRNNPGANYVTNVRHFQFRLLRHRPGMSCIFVSMQPAPQWSRSAFPVNYG